MNLAAHQQTMVDHFVWLYRHPYAGPDVSRDAVATYIKHPNCPFKKIGYEVKAALDAQEQE